MVLTTCDHCGTSIGQLDQNKFEFDVVGGKDYKYLCPRCYRTASKEVFTSDISEALAACATPGMAL